MSQFSEAFAGAFDVSYSVFGDDCVIAEHTYPCVIHAADVSETVRGGLNAGRGQDAGGTVFIKQTDWIDALRRLAALGKKTKGAQITIPGGTFRVLNDPDVGYASHTIELRLGALT